MLFDKDVITLIICISCLTMLLTWIGMWYIVDQLMFKKLLYNTYKQKQLFPDKEAILFRMLLEKLKNKKNKYYLLAHVRLKDLFDIEENKDGKETIDIGVRGHVDFLIVDFKTLEPKLAIELDGWSHKLLPQQKRMDHFKNKVFKKYSTIPLKRFWNNDLFKNDKTSEKVDELISCLE